MTGLEGFALIAIISAAGFLCDRVFRAHKSIEKLVEQGEQKAKSYFVDEIQTLGKAADHWHANEETKANDAKLKKGRR